MTLIYKICAMTEWQKSIETGQYTGSPDDIRDGFIHLSTPDQLQGTADRHFSGKRDLVLVAVETERLGPALRFEPSRGGALFPHLYAPLPVAAAVAVTPLATDRDGRLVLPVLSGKDGTAS
ncbi:MAG: DUF952 domain-containing protein [Hyphomicrobiaceae bacterium]